MAGKFKKEGTRVYLWLSHVDVWQKSTQHCKAIILQSKIKFLKRGHHVPAPQAPATLDLLPLLTLHSAQNQLLLTRKKIQS